MTYSILHTISVAARVKPRLNIHDRSIRDMVREHGVCADVYCDDCIFCEIHGARTGCGGKVCHDAHYDTPASRRFRVYILKLLGVTS